MSEKKKAGEMDLASLCRHSRLTHRTELDCPFNSSTQDALIHHAEEYLQLSMAQQFVLAVAAGMFITGGALLSVVLSTDIVQLGVQKLLLGFGFVAGFSLVILSGTALFTEIKCVRGEALIVWEVLPFEMDGEYRATWWLTVRPSGRAVHAPLKFDSSSHLQRYHTALHVLLQPLTTASQMCCHVLAYCVAGQHHRRSHSCWNGKRCQCL
jgi:hypothetical protein